VKYLVDGTDEKGLGEWSTAVADSGGGE
jgi:hypothetical protein